MAADSNFVSLPFRLFSILENSIHTKHYPYINFYRDISSYETNYCTPIYYKNNFHMFL